MLGLWVATQQRFSPHFSRFSRRAETSRDRRLSPQPFEPRKHKHMPAMFDKGVFTTSTWHGLEEIGTMSTGDDMIEHAERVQAWPVDVTSEPVVAHLEDGTTVDAPRYNAIVGHYRSLEEKEARQAVRKVLGINGGRYRATLPEEWRELVHAATLAGAKPTGCFSLHGGSRVVATFEIDDCAGIKTHLVIADAFDGSMMLVCGFTSIRTVCANTLAAAMSTDGKAWAKIRHTSSLEDKVKALAVGISEAVKQGRKVVETFNKACDTRLDRDAAHKAFDLLFPEAAEDATPAAKTRADNARTEAKVAAGLDVNKVGNKPGNLGTLWNAATYLVDRKTDGSARKARGGSQDNMISSMLFGARAKRVEAIQKVIEVVMVDGTVEHMSATEAREHGVDDKAIGKAVLADMLDTDKN
jgi:hypothetical protein